MKVVSDLRRGEEIGCGGAGDAADGRRRSRVGSHSPSQPPPFPSPNPQQPVVLSLSLSFSLCASSVTVVERGKGRRRRAPPDFVEDVAVVARLQR